MSILNRVLSCSPYREIEGLQKPTDLSINTGRATDWYVNNQNDFRKVSNKLEVGYKINNPLKEIAVSVEWWRNMNEDDFSFQNNINIDLYLTLVNREVREHKLKAQYFRLLDDMEGLHKECEEEGYEVCSDLAKHTARDVLRQICFKFPDNEYFIYPTEEREIAIDCNPVDKRGILILCGSDGGIACFVTVDGENSSFRDEMCSEFFYDSLWRSFKRIKNDYYPDRIHDLSNIPTAHNSKCVQRALTKLYQPVELSSTAKVAI